MKFVDLSLLGKWDSSVFVLLLVTLGSFFFCIIVTRKARQYTEKEARNNLISKYKELIDKIYNMIISDKELIKLRNKQVNLFKIGISLFFVGFFIIAMFGDLGYFILILGIIFLFRSGKVPYDRNYKEKVIKFALKEYDDKLDYSPLNGISSAQYDMGNFGTYDVFNSEDLIKGVILGHNFMMSDVHIQYTYEDSEGNTVSQTLFNGPVAIVELSKHVDFELEIKWNSNKVINKNKIVEVDNLEFEEVFDVYTNDKIKAMVVLTPAVTNRMLDLYKKYGFEFQFKFVGNYMYFRFFSGNLFIANSKSPREEAIGVAKYFEIIDGIKDIMKEVIESTKSVRR